MLKLLGAAVVMLSCAGMLSEWRKNYKSRICELNQLCRLYRSAKNAMEEERIHMPDFVRRYRERECQKETAEGEMLKCLEVFLNERCYSTGEEAWKQAYLRTERWWHLTWEERELLKQSGDAFFGRNLAENMQRLLLYEQRMQDFLKNVEQEYREKNRVWTPVGMLLGVMLVVILL